MDIVSIFAPKSEIAVRAEVRVRIVFIVREAFPTFRSDVAALFGRYLPRLGIQSDYVSEAAVGATDVVWGGGQQILCSGDGASLIRQLRKSRHVLRVLFRMSGSQCDIVQVRDMAITAALALLIAKSRKVKMTYWMSFPMDKAQISRARGGSIWSLGSFWFPWIQGQIGRVLLRKVVLKWADHVFVQSEQMKGEMVALGCSPGSITPVPMGVDMELLRDVEVDQKPRQSVDPVIVHLGVLARSRDSDVLLDILTVVRQIIPTVSLLCVGDADSDEYRDYLEAQIAERNLSGAVHITGWLDREHAWRLIRHSDVGISLFPNDELYASASPTKLIECIALGVPVVANDHPDQARVIAESGAGLSVPWSVDGLALAVIAVLQDDTLRAATKTIGPQYVEAQRSYARIADDVAAQYFRIATPSA